MKINFKNLFRSNKESIERIRIEPEKPEPTTFYESGVACEQNQAHIGYNHGPNDVCRKCGGITKNCVLKIVSTPIKFHWTNLNEEFSEVSEGFWEFSTELLIFHRWL